MNSYYKGGFRFRQTLVPLIVVSLPLLPYIEGFLAGFTTDERLCSVSFRYPTPAFGTFLAHGTATF